MEEVVLKVKVEGTGDGEAKIKSVKQQLREAKAAAAEAEEGTEAWAAALNKAALAADKLEDVNKAVKALDPQAKAQAFGSLFNSIAGGFQTITGLYGLLGQESKDLEKVLLQVQSASALAMGIQSLVEASEQWGRLKLVVLDAFESIKKAGTATQLGLLGIAAVVVGLVYELATMNQKVVKLIENTDEFNKSAAEEVSKIQLLTKVAKDENKSKADRQKAITEINKISPKYLGNITLETIGTEKATKEIELYTQALIKKAKAQAAQEELTKRYKNLIDLQIEFNKLDAKALSDTTIRGAVVAKQYQVIGDAYRKTVADIQTLTDMVMANDDVIDDMFTKGDERIMKQSDLLTDLAYSYISIADELQRLNLVPPDQTVKAIADTDNLLSVYDQYWKDQIEGADNAAKEIAGISDTQFKLELEQAEALRNAKLSIADNTVQGLQALGDLLSKNGQKNTAFQKTLALAQIAIDTAKAIASTIAGATQAAAAGGPAAPFLQIAYITSGIASVLASMAAARKALQEPAISQAGGGGGSGSMPTVSGLTPPAIQSPQNTSSFLLQDEQNFKVYVLESDITNSQQGVQQNKKKALLTI
jgi:hypothetical protein